MSLKERIDSDLKAAMLSGDKALVTTLRGLKSAILYIEVAEGRRDTGLDDDGITTVLRKEAKKRQESIDLFTRGGNETKASDERRELAIINEYLPAQLSDEALNDLVQEAIQQIGSSNSQELGRIIGKVKELSQGNVDGARIAKAVKQRISQ
jgi:uncharacterized protein